MDTRLIKCFLDLLIQLPQYRKVLICLHPTTNAKHDTALSQLCDKYLCLLIVQHQRMLRKEPLQDCLRRLDRVLVGNADCDLQLAPVCCRHIDDHIVGEIAVWHNDLAIIDRVKRRIQDLDFLYRPFLSLREDVITDLKRLKQKNQKAAGKVGQATL